jgi:hypothetical protein
VIIETYGWSRRFIPWASSSEQADLNGVIDGEITETSVFSNSFIQSSVIVWTTARIRWIHCGSGQLQGLQRQNTSIVVFKSRDSHWRRHRSEIGLVWNLCSCLLPRVRQTSRMEHQSLGKSTIQPRLCASICCSMGLVSWEDSTMRWRIVCK